MKPTVIKAILNEITRPETNPNVPMTPEAVARDAIECARAGSCFVHFHARDKQTGDWREHDVDFYRTAADGFLSQVDVLWYPPQGFAPTPEERWAHVTELAADPAARLETITIDPGGDPSTEHHATPGYESAQIASDKKPIPAWQHWEWFCREAQRLNIRPIFGVNGPEVIRRVLYYVDIDIVDEPVILNLHFAERMNAIPATVESLQNYLRTWPSSVRMEWFLSPLFITEEERMRLTAYAITHGGHVQVGVGRAPTQGYGGAPPTNAQLIEDMVDLVRKLGGRPASVDEAREIFGVRPRTYAGAGARMDGS